MNDVMIDFETWGTSPNAVAVQIGACYFDRMSGKIGETFKKNICADSAIKSGAQIDASTIYWWLERDDAARKSILAEPREPIFEVMTAFNTFLAPAKNIWSHATFDFPILSQSLRRLKIKPAFRYTAAKDIRTLMELSGYDSKTLKRDGTHHDGLDDSVFQVKYCVEAMKFLRGLK